MEIKYKPIGIVHSPFKEPKGVPIQPEVAKGIKGTVEIFPQYEDGLIDIEGFSHIIIVSHFHLAKGFKLIVTPYMDEETHGVFATRAPARPNSIGLSIVKLVGKERNILYIEDVDIVDGTPVLDIKPYVPQFDVRHAYKIGWLEKNVDKLPESRDDGRFL